MNSRGVVDQELLDKLHPWIVDKTVYVKVDPKDSKLCSIIVDGINISSYDQIEETMRNYTEAVELSEE